MTRINCVPVTELSDKHLLAEYRELPRVFTLARPGVPIPETYRLGKGHVTFFYDKLRYLDTRYQQLVFEMRRRRFKVNFEIPRGNRYSQLYGDWEPTPEALALNRARIAERTKASKQKKGKL